MGEPLAEVELPASLSLVEADRDHVWGWQEDEPDVPGVVILYPVDLSEADADRISPVFGALVVRRPQP